MKREQPTKNKREENRNIEVKEEGGCSPRVTAAPAARCCRHAVSRSPCAVVVSRPIHSPLRKAPLSLSLSSPWSVSRLRPHLPLAVLGRDLPFSSHRRTRWSSPPSSRAASFSATPFIFFVSRKSHLSHEYREERSGRGGFLGEKDLEEVSAKDRKSREADLKHYREHKIFLLPSF